MPRRKKIINLSGHDILLKDIEPLLYDLLNEVKFSYIDSSSIEIINTSADNDSVIIQLKGDFLHISYLNSWSKMERKEMVLSIFKKFVTTFI